MLIVEDDWLIAEALADQIEALGCGVVGPVGSVAEALDALEKSSPEAALLDVNLGTETSFPIADALVGRGIPFAFVTAYSRSQLPERFASSAVLMKPVSAHSLRNHVRELAARVHA
ncbi:response regulator [Plastoroseomonas hellenica]|uniref:response regulator n=1 Tax=Plastoroseomonas hellenica TaxID=2687306 RepID=UPI001BABB85E